MPKVLPEYLELRRQQILDAAAACFGRRGFHLSTMQDICKEADLSPGAVYRYFPSKESIIEAMCDRGQAGSAAALESGLHAGGTGAVLDELIRIFFLERDNLEDLGTCALMIELVAEAPRNPAVREWLTRNERQVRAPLAELVRHAQAAGEINPNLDADAVARVLVALYQGFVTQKLVEPELATDAYAAVMRALFGGKFWQSEAAPASSKSGPAVALRH